MSSSGDLYDFMKELDYLYDRIRYYDDVPTKLQWIEKLNRWRGECREYWQHMDQDEYEMRLESLEDELHDARRRYSTESIEHGKTKKELMTLQVKLELEQNDALLLQSAMLTVLGKDKLDAVLRYAKEMDAELNRTTPKDGVN